MVKDSQNVFSWWSKYWALLNESFLSNWITKLIFIYLFRNSKLTVWQVFDCQLREYKFHLNWQLFRLEQPIEKYSSRSTFFQCFIMETYFWFDISIIILEWYVCLLDRPVSGKILSYDTAIVADFDQIHFSNWDSSTFSCVLYLVIHICIFSFFCFEHIFCLLNSFLPLLTKCIVSFLFEIE